MKWYKKGLIGLSVAALLLSVSPFTTVVTAYTKEVSLANVDKQIISVVNQTIKELVPNHNLEPVAVSEYKNDFGVQIIEFELSDESSRVLVNKKSKQLISAYIPFTGEEVDPAIMENVLDQLKRYDSELEFELSHATRLKEVEDKRDEWIFYDKKSYANHLVMDNKTGNLIEVQTDYRISKLNPKLVQVAKKALVDMKGKSGAVKHVERHTAKRYNYDFFTITFANGNRVKVDGRTHKVYVVYLKEKDKGSASTSFTSAKVKKTATPLVKKLFNIDLKDYTVPKPIYAYAFKKGSKPTISHPEVGGYINDKGEFYQFWIDTGEAIFN
ncbi:hypothetical protein [Paenibacillus sp. 481]|uniref:hypothetical protein n=1 Tax=Paenibacillus sp. 481 TaxID=2835869 RepID=UPI001E5534E0|nr:hypothetical protein [Paenibacillus sp. 481]UHA75075.1 hypothetical protein KIK04_08660 [Paenibacillus sp. 481]